MAEWPMGLREAMRTLWDPTDQTGAAARSVAAYRRMGYADLNRRTELAVKGDTLFLLGCGPSINRIDDRQWAEIEANTSIGLNFWMVHPFAPDYYVTPSETGPNPETGEEDRVEMLRARLPDYARTIFLCRGDEVNSFRFHTLPYGRTLLEGAGARCLFMRELFQYSGSAVNPVLLIRFLIDHGLLHFGAPAAFVPKPTATMPLMYALAPMLGCRNVVFCGVDMWDMRYFYDDAPDDYPLAGLGRKHIVPPAVLPEDYGGRVFTQRQIFRDMAEVFAARFGMRAYTMNPQSRLASIFPVWGGEKTRHAVRCPAAAKPPLPPAPPPRRPLSIAMLTNSFLPIAGGMELQMDRLAWELSARGHAVTVFAPIEQQPGADAPTPYELVRFAGGFAAAALAESPRRRPLGLAADSLAMEFLRRHRARRFDAISAHSAFEAAPFAVALRGLFGVPVLTRCHGMDINRRPDIGYGWRLDPLKNVPIRAALEESDLCVAISHDVAAELAPIVAAERIACIPNGIDDALFSPGPDPGWRVRLGIAADAPVVAMVGRHIPSKRLREGMEAFAQVLAACPGAHLLHAGKDAADLAAAAADLGIADAVHLLGEVAHADLPGVYRAADVFLNPSVLETFGNVTAEAMACGLPVVAADAPGTSFQVVDGETGYLVRMASPPRLAAALIRFLAQPEGGRTFGAAGRARVASTFSWRVVADAYEVQYLRLAAAAEVLFRDAGPPVEPLAAAVDRWPESIPALRALVRRIAADGDDEGAIDLLLAATRLHPLSAELHEDLAGRVSAALTRQREIAGGRTCIATAEQACQAMALIERHEALLAAMP